MVEEQKPDETPKEEVKKEDSVTDAYEEQKRKNDLLEAELLRGEQLRAKQLEGGRSLAGTDPKTPQEEFQEKVDEEVKGIVNAFH